MSFFTILAKVRIVGLSNLHTILDRVIDLNAPGAVEQYIRDLQASRKQVDDAVAQSIATERRLQKEHSAREKRITELDATIVAILTDDDPANDAAAVTKQVERDRLASQDAAASVQHAEAIETRGSLEQALAVIDSKIGDMTTRLETLRSTESQVRAKEAAASAIDMARRHLEQQPGGSVDSALKRAEERGGVAQVKLERAMDGMNKASGADAAQTDAMLKIEALKKRLAAERVAKATAPAA